MRCTSFLVALSFTACAHDATSPLASDTSVGAEAPVAPSPDPEEGIAAVLPGHYDATVVGVSDNACGLLAESVVSESVRFEWLDDDTFLWADRSACAMDGGGGYVCDLATEQLHVAPDAQLLLSTYATVDVVDERTLAETRQVTVQCDGPGCTAYAAYVGASFPCDMVVETLPSWRSR